MRWTTNLAYAVGLITTDGNLSKDGRHIELTSKDLDQINNFIKALKLSNKISTKKSSYKPNQKYYRIQFSNVMLYRFLMKIGLTPNKSKTIGKLLIPEKFFADFFRGCIDGDGNISIVKHPESQKPQLRLRLASSSNEFLQWVRDYIKNYWSIPGGFISREYKSTQYLTYSKADAIILLGFIYYKGVKYFLQRKFDYFNNKMPEW